MAATAAGEFRHAITFQRATYTRDSLGSRQPSGWATLVTAKAKVLYGTGAERREAGVETGTQAATFRVRSSAGTRGVTYQDRISFNGAAWDITGISPLMLAPAEIEFTAVASRG
jgi:head-tail adaptor